MSFHLLNSPSLGGEVDMSEPTNSNLQQVETTLLHLNKFAPDQSPMPPQADDGPTVFIRRAAVETVDQSSSPVTAPSLGNKLPAREMLGAIVYCYAKGIFSSQEIEERMMRDAELRKSLSGEVPDANAIRRFRRMNRQAIHATLEKYYRHERRRQKAAAAEVMNQVLPGAQPPEKSPLQVSKSFPLPAPGEDTAIFVRREATDQLDKATFVDGMSRSD
jgi:Transposase domain (DUF772)